MALLALLNSNDTFDGILHTLGERLTQQELESFRDTTSEDVEAIIEDIQSRREAQREMMDMTRLQPFLQKMLQFNEILSIFTDSSIHLAIICWGPMSFMLKRADTYKDALDKVLDAYHDIGVCMPSLRPYKIYFERCPEARKLLELMSADLLDFHCRAIRCLDHPRFTQIFRSLWNDSKRCFDNIVQNLVRQKQFIEGPLDLVSIGSAGSLPPITMNFIQNYVAGNSYENIEVSGTSQVLFGDTYRSDLSDLHDPMSNAAEMRQIIEQLGGLKLSLAEQERRRQKDQKSTLAEWIAGFQAIKHHEQARDIHESYADTGSWILRNDKVAQWLNDELPRKPMLWIHGKPGAGKTILASVIIQACIQLPNSDTMYFYCKQDDDTTSTSLSILKGLLLQAMDCRPRFKPYFDEQRSKLGEPVLCTESTAKKLFDIVCHAGNRLYLIIDGLDECPPHDRSSILKYLHSLVQKIGEDNLGNLRLLIVSQKERDIGGNLPEADELELQTSHNQNDIYIFVSKWAAKIRTKFALNDSQEDIIRNQVCWRAAGQFLYAKLVVEHLYNQVSVKDLQEELEAQHFPKELSDAYNRILHRIQKYNTEAEWKAAQRILGWMVCAARPLKWHEMQGAISIDTDKEEVNFFELQFRRPLDDICGALVSVSRGRISLVHSTAKQFIAESELVDVHQVECELLTLSLNYLSFACFEPELDGDEICTFLTAGYFAFADYAVAKWIYHFYQVVDHAKLLAEPSRIEKRTTGIRRLCEAMEYFVQEYEEDLEESWKGCTDNGIRIRLNVEVSQLLEACRHAEAMEYVNQAESAETMEGPGTFEEAKFHFERLYVHAEMHKRKIRTRNIITLKRLQKAFERIRTTVEKNAIERSQFDENFATFYGDRVFKCSKTTCFYFHEGFRTKKMRDKHVARHERPFACDEPDCTSGEFGFSTKAELDKHQIAFHPDLEMKAKQFAEEKPKPSGTKKWLCSICDRSFARNNILKDHLLTHSGHKPHECSRCGRAFTRKNDCARHERQHDNK